MLKSKLSEIDNKRAASQPLPKGSAPYTCSTFFKVRQPGERPVAKSWDHRFSEDSQRQHTSSLKAAARAAHPDMISLGTARPWAEYFPWKALEIICPGPEGLGSTVSMDCVKGEDEYDLDIVMNYGYAGGSPQVLRWVTEHMELLHDPPYSDWECAITCGTTSAMEIAFRLFCNPGDTILMESHTYTGTLSAALAQGLKIQGVAMDELGLVPEDLNHKLENWDSLKGPKPSVLYMIPCGQNPTGSTQSLERRQAIYRVTEAHDLYIFEDDPYYLIQLAEDSSEDSDKGLDADDYLRSLPASYLSLDVSGRVLRMDTTSKVLAPGLRCGLWGHEGFIRWAMMLSSQYRHRRDILSTACKAHLPSGICSWRVPDVGMFLWINLNLSYPSLAVNNKDSEWEAYRYMEDTIFSKAQENGVVVSKGSWFITNVTEMRGVSFRLTFAAAQEEGIDPAVERFGRAIRSYLDDPAL
ncbi:Pyridoxal phosphate-dependent transferase, major domain [Fusarium oxysporum f. sp. vasinfectum]|nr:Pyridoxal phosphate-dependent transferase, major domain [Fusarium oxysporum f. sp. vasinfectum]